MFIARVKQNHPRVSLLFRLYALEKTHWYILRDPIPLEICATVFDHWFIICGHPAHDSINHPLNKLTPSCHLAIPYRYASVRHINLHLMTFPAWLVQFSRLNLGQKWLTCVLNVETLTQSKRILNKMYCLTAKKSMRGEMRYILINSSGRNRHRIIPARIRNIFPRPQEPVESLLYLGYIREYKG